MSRLYGEELRKSILATKQQMLDAIESRDERIKNWETDEDDCFISQRVEENAIRECNLQLEILSGDGMMDYDAVIDQEGNERRVRQVHTKYGWAYASDISSDKTVFASSIKALCKKTGWHQETIRVPCWTKFSTPYGGMMGVYCGSYEVVRWHTNMVTGEYFGYPG